MAPEATPPKFLRNICLGFALLYHPCHRLDSPGTVRFLQCGLFALSVIIAGASVHFFVSAAHKKKMATFFASLLHESDGSEESGFTMLWKILSGDMGDEKFQEWVQGLGGAEARQSEKQD